MLKKSCWIWWRQLWHQIDVSRIDGLSQSYCSSFLYRVCINTSLNTQISFAQSLNLEIFDGNGVSFIWWKSDAVPEANPITTYIKKLFHLIKTTTCYLVTLWSWWWHIFFFPNLEGLHSPKCNFLLRFR